MTPQRSTSNPDREWLSLEMMTGRSIAVEDVEDRIAGHFANVFDREITRSV